MNPEMLAREVEESYRRYLTTTFYFKDAVFRASFEKALESGHLSKGPIPEPMPEFKRGQSPRKLFPEILGSRPREEFLHAIEGDRPLYRHQEQAICKVADGRNVIVATGTGSGKTEAFIYPILLHLYQEFLEGQLRPGVRALVLYPMNALANDQRDRLGEIGKRLSDEKSPFNFTFGQYIGETPEDERDSKRNARDFLSRRLPGELVLRSEMRTAPPHILLTNYSMLEYLLLRPHDSPLFDDGNARWWTFLVLDEAHQYRGSRGIEMAILLRRLKQRLREGGRTGPFRCIATSATLGGEEDKAGIATFASDLFGEKFDADDVILGETESAPTVENPSSDRYHFFLRALEGAFVSFFPEKKVLLDRKVKDENAVAFEVSLCRECGQHYLVGKQQDGKLTEAIRDPSQSDFGADYFFPIENGDSEPSNDDTLFLCVRCGQLWPSGNESRCMACGHESPICVKQVESASTKEDEAAKCYACGYKSPDPVREVIHGTDGPHAVIATRLYQSLPAERKKILAFADSRQEAAFFAWYLGSSYEDILARNLLLNVVRERGPHAPNGLSLNELAIGLRDLFRERQVFSAAVGDLELLTKAYLSAYRELLTDEQRISLEGVGLLCWSIKWPGRLSALDLLEQAPWSLTAEEAENLMFVLLSFVREDRAVEIRTAPGVSVLWGDLNLQASQMRVRIGPPKKQQDIRSWDGGTGKRAQFLSKLLMRKDMPKTDALQNAVTLLRGLWDMVMDTDLEQLFSSAGDARRLNPDWWRVRSVADDDIVFRCNICGRVQAHSVLDACPRHNCPGTLQEVRSTDIPTNHYRLLYRENLQAPLRVEEHTAQLSSEKAREFQRDFKNGRIHVLSCSTTFELGVDLGDLDTIFLRNVPPEPFNYTQRVGRAGRRPGHAGFALTYCRRNPHDLYHFADPKRIISGKIHSPVLRLRNDKIISRHITATALSAFFRKDENRFGNVQGLFEDLERPKGVSDFQSFLRGHQSELEKSLRRIVPEEMHPKLELDTGGWVEKLVGENSRFNLAEAEVSSDYQNVRRLEDQSSNARDHATAGWAKRRADTIAQEDVLSFLSRKAVIPKYGFPVDVVQLDTGPVRRSSESFDVELERDLSIAISEFAPTSKLIANKKEWISYGLKKVIGKEWGRYFYKRCQKHNVFLRWKTSEPEPASPCDSHCRKASYVIPIFGFLSDRRGPQAPKRRTARMFSTRPYFAGPIGPSPGTIAYPKHSTLITVQKASPGSMVVLCEGRKGEGFYVCEECGAGFRNTQIPHDTPYGKPCPGKLIPVSLGHEFETDVLQLQFHRKPEGGLDPLWFAHSLAYALVPAAAEILEVPSSDLSATVSYSEVLPVPPIVLYDNVPGGAGLVAELEKEHVLRRCMESALDRVSGRCGCGENTSCYGCLRNYRNQFAHPKLQRGPVHDYLSQILSEW